MGAGPGRRAALTERRQRPARTNPDYRDAYLPDDVDLSNPARNDLYRRASIDVPGIGDPIGDNDVTIPATRVAWGLTVMNDAPNRGNAVAFVQILLAPGGVGQESLDTLDAPLGFSVWDRAAGRTRGCCSSRLRGHTLGRPVALWCRSRRPG